jgi:serine/threonine protein kinase
MIDKDYNVKISDFGISSKLNIDQSHISIVFRKGKDYY